jgi:hypothetical protein
MHYPGLMSLVLLAVFWQPGVTAATNGPRTETVVDANGNLRVPADYRTAYQFLGSKARVRKGLVRHGEG